MFLLPTRYACALTEPPARPISVALQALGLLIQRRLVNEAAFYADRVELIVLPPLCPVAVSPTDFSRRAISSNEPVRPREAGLTAGTPPRDIRNVCCRCTTTAPTPEHHPTRAAFTNPPKWTPREPLRETNVTDSLAESRHQGPCRGANASRPSRRAWVRASASTSPSTSPWPVSAADRWVALHCGLKHRLCTPAHRAKRFLGRETGDVD